MKVTADRIEFKNEDNLNFYAKLRFNSESIGSKHLAPSEIPLVEKRMKQAINSILYNRIVEELLDIRHKLITIAVNTDTVDIAHDIQNLITEIQEV